MFWVCLVLPDDPDRVVESKTMTFHNLTKEDAQVIQCNATNKHGYMYANAYLNVLCEYISYLTSLNNVCLIISFTILFGNSQFS